MSTQTAYLIIGSSVALLMTFIVLLFAAVGSELNRIAAALEKIASRYWGSE